MIQNDQSAFDTDVVIVGGGPVGLGLAIELGQRGIRCVLSERHTEPQPIPKGQNLTQRSMEHFHFWGAEAELRAARTIPPGYGIGGLTAYGTLLGSYQYDWMQRELVKPYYFKDNERLPQYQTENVLRQRLAQIPCVQALYGWDCTAITQDDTGAEVSLCEHEGSPPKTIRARYVVGCDGSRSITREQAHISQTLSDHDRRMVLLVFKSKALHQLLDRYPGKSYFCVLHPELKGYWRFFGRVDLGNTWFFHAPVPLGTTADNFDFIALLHQAAGAEFEAEIEHIGFWNLRFALADRYRAGRIFIAGDAAHSHPPYGGYGVNTGFEDARNIGWKLAAVLQGWGHEALLDSYDAERRPVFASTRDDFIAKSIENDRDFLQTYDLQRDPEAFEQAWQARSKGAVGEVHAFEPHYEGSPLTWPAAAADAVCSAKGSHQFKARAGHHLAPAMLDSGKNIYQALGQGYALLAVGTQETDQRLWQETAKSMGIPLTLIAQEVNSETDRYEMSWVLIRPDQFVAWASPTPHIDVSQIRSLFEHLMR
jgi:2-polyprenyl-6-methoxyphenol hydroxylase-like FAD-dependent oxidoreductase